MGIDEGLGRGGEELWNAEGIQPSTQESDPPPQAQHYSSPWRGWPQEVSMTCSEQRLPEAWHSLPWDICLSMHPCLPALRSRQEVRRGCLLSPAYLSDFRDGQRCPRRCWEHCWGWWGGGFGPSTPHPTSTSGATAGQSGPGSLGDSRLPQGGAGISKLEAQGHVSLAL